MKSKDKKQHQATSHYTEAVLDVEKLEDGTKVPIPHEEAVERAKEWIDENEL